MNASKINILLIAFLLFLTLNILLQNNINAETNEIRWEDVEDKSHSFVFKLELNSSIYTEHLLRNEFVYDDLISKVRLKVMNFPTNVSSISSIIEMISPSRIKVFNTQVELKDKTDYAHLDPRIRLNESGVWFRKLTFEINPVESYEENEVMVIYEYIDEQDKLIGDSQLIKITTLGMNGTVSIENGLPVYTLAEYAGIRSARASEEAAIEQSKNAKANEELLKWEKRATIFMGVTAGATIFLAIITVVVTYKNIGETRKERKRESIKKLIGWLMDKAILEFKELRDALKKIEGGYIIPLPNRLYLSSLQVTHWNGFRREMPNYFNEIQKYLKMKDKYMKKLKECKDKIEDAIKIKKEGIKSLNPFLKRLVTEKQIQMGPELYFEKKIIKFLAESILHQEGRGGAYSQKVFEEFEDEWLKIRKENTSISENISALIKIAKGLEDYICLGPELETERDKLMEKYDINDIEIPTILDTI